MGGLDHIEPREAEPMPITLTRMEGKLDNVMEKVSDLRAEVTMHRGQITALEAKTQQLQSDMRSAEESRRIAALAVRAADDDRVAAAKALVDNSARAWTPWQRIFAAFGGLAGLAGALYYFWLISHH